MPLYHPALRAVDPKETRRYAGLSRAEGFREEHIEAACEDALLLAEPRGIYELYDYDCAAQIVKSQPPFHIEGKKIGAHLAGCEKVILLAVTVGGAIEKEVSARFRRGEYTSAVLLDAAATTAVEQVADAVEHMLAPKIARAGFTSRWRFSPGYGDWPLTQQPEMIRTTNCRSIGVQLTSSLMLEPRKSVTAIIGLARTQGKASDTDAASAHTSCDACTQTDCPARKTDA